MKKVCDSNGKEMVAVNQFLETNRSVYRHISDVLGDKVKEAHAIAEKHDKESGGILVSGRTYQENLTEMLAASLLKLQTDVMTAHNAEVTVNSIAVTFGALNMFPPEDDATLAEV